MSRVEPRRLAALRAGEPDALGALYEEFATPVLGWCIRLGGPGVDAEDAAQLVFEKAFAALPRFRGESSLSTWLFGVTRGVLANQRRRAAFRRFLHLDAVPEPAAPGEHADGELLAAELRARVQRALSRLPEGPRELLVLAVLEERPAAEVAEMLGVPVGTVYSRQHAARRAFAEALRAEGVTGREGLGEERGGGGPGEGRRDGGRRAEEPEDAHGGKVVPLRRAP